MPLFLFSCRIYTWTLYFSDVAPLRLPHVPITTDIPLCLLNTPSRLHFGIIMFLDTPQSLQRDHIELVAVSDEIGFPLSKIGLLST